MDANVCDKDHKFNNRYLTVTTQWFWKELADQTRDKKRSAARRKTDRRRGVSPGDDHLNATARAFNDPRGLFVQVSVGASDNIEPIETAARS
jgi:hypothetical protein